MSFLTTKAAVFAELTRRGAVKAVIDFDGGNDEGGPTSVVLRDADGNKVGELETYYQTQKYDQEKRAYVPVEMDEELTRDAKLQAQLVQPIFEEWGGFAGDFSVYGQLTWDVAAAKVDMNYQESVMEYHERSWSAG